MSSGLLCISNPKFKSIAQEEWPPVFKTIFFLVNLLIFESLAYGQFLKSNLYNGVYDENYCTSVNILKQNNHENQLRE